MKISISRKGLLLVLVPLICEIGFIVILVQLQYQLESAIARESRRREILAQLDHVTSVIAKGFTSFAFWTFTQRDEMFDSMHESLSAGSQSLTTLEKLVGNQDKEQLTLLQLLHQEIDRTPKFFAEVKREFRQGDPQRLVQFRETARHFLQRIPEYTSRLSESIEREGQNDPIHVEDYRRYVLQWVVFGVVMNIIASISLSAFFSRNITRRLQTMRINVDNYANNLPLLPVVTGSDEITELDQAFHCMARALGDASRKERAMIENAVDVIGVLNSDLVFLRVGRSCLHVFGYHPEELAFQNVSVLLEPGNTAFSQRLETIREKEDIATFECQLLHKQGVLIWVEMAVCWSATEQAFFCVFHNIAERKRVETLKQEFTNMINHDMRTPLTSLSTFLDLLQSGAYGIPQSKMSSVESMKRILGHLIALINDLLDAEKLDSGLLRLSLDRHNLVEIIADVLHVVHGYALQRDVTVTVSAPTDLHLICDRQRLLQVLQNLVGNAIKYSPDQGTVTVSVTTSNEAVHIEVSDQGPGVPDEYTEAIFDKFKQIDLPEYKRSASTGLGLHISKGIIQLHDGEIGITNRPGGGSCFWIEIPLKPSVREHETICVDEASTHNVPESPGSETLSVETTRVHAEQRLND